jgi:hypothetical protein
MNKGLLDVSTVSIMEDILRVLKEYLDERWCPNDKNIGIV